MEDTAPARLEDVWPALPQAAWGESCVTLQLWTQIVGKVRLELMPPLNHSWNVTLYPTARGLTTGPMPHGRRFLQIDFDFIEHVLLLETSDGARSTVALRPMTVAAFYREVMAALDGLGTPVQIWRMPVEVERPISFDQDSTHQSYDPEYVQRFWRVLLQTTRVVQIFRARFTGKVSPVHLFWGALDLACTRFSGRRAPEHPSMAGLPDRVTRDAYSHEVSSCGFWAGAPGVDALFYSYAYPEPPGYAESKILPTGASFNERWASLCCRMKRCGGLPILTLPCWTFYRVRMRPRLIVLTGTELILRSHRELQGAAEMSDQLGEGRSAVSMTREATGPLVALSLRPSCC